MWQLSVPWWEFVVRGMVVYVFLLVFLRLTGKRQTGQYAPYDLVLLDLGKPYVVNDSNLLYLCGWSPFNGYRFQSTIEMTLVNGQIAWQNGQVTDQVLGKRLTFNR